MTTSRLPFGAAAAQSCVSRALTPVVIGRIYESIFPEVSVWPMGNCVEVARFVRRAAAAASLHWLKVYGLIDRDSRTASEQDIDSV